jgi:nitroimidazol reductase NimA-like FMN-containing flavoprotein (pyridoxamine 5'-phosphate oxidase superfamily)
LYQDGKIVFHCAWEGKKLDIIATNPNCCFEVDEFAGDISYHYDSRCHLDYDSVLAFGVARIEEDKDEKIRLLQSFSEKYNEIYKKPIEKGGKRFRDVDSCCCVVVDVTSLTGRSERNVNGKREKKVWQHQF